MPRQIISKVPTTVGQLTPNAKNPRKIKDEQLVALEKSMRRFGDLGGIVYNATTGRLVGGHQRSKKIPFDAKIEVTERLKKRTEQGTIAHGFVEYEGERFQVRVVEWDETTEKAANIAANKHGGSWDMETLKQDLLDLNKLNFDLDLTGFIDAELKEIKLDFMESKDGLTDADSTPGLPNKTNVNLGDLFILGNHRLLCGDSTKEEDVDRLLNGITPLLMVTDPPYGVEYNAEWRSDALKEKALSPSRTGKVANDNRADWTDAWKLCRAQIAYVWHASQFADVVMKSLRDADFEIKQQIIWNKSVLAISRRAYHWKHEPCWYAIRNGKDQNWVGDRKGTTVWDAASPNNSMSGSKEEKTPHPTQKPALLYEIPIGNHTRPGDILYEPFGGSGTAIIACERMGRKCLTMELDPFYCFVILRRWAEFTGKDPMLVDPKTGELSPWFPT